MEKLKKFVVEYKIYIFCIIILIFAVIYVLIQHFDRKNTLKVNSNEINSNDEKIAVYITGEVINPGVYYIDNNSRLYNAIDIAGGTTEFADISKLNLAQKLNDSEKIVVPRIVEKDETLDENVVLNDENEIGSFSDDSYDNGKININSAGINELQSITGIGASTAKKIIEYRNKNKFETIEDIMNVPGIGEGKFENMKDEICVK